MHEPDPLRVDRRRLRDLGRRCRAPCRSTRPPPPTRSSGSSPTPAPWPSSSRPATHAAAVEPGRDRLPGLRTSGSSSQGDVDEPQPRRRRRRRRRARRRARAARPRQPRHDHLHLGHHRPAQGLRADPRQLPRPRREHRRALAAVVKAPASSTLLFLPLAHVFARFIQVLAVDAPGRGWATPPTSRRCSTTSRRSSRRSCSPCPASSRRSTTRAEAKAEAGGKGKIFAGAAATAIDVVRGARTPAAPAFGLRLRARGVRQAGLRQAARGHGRQCAVRRLRRRAARHPARPLLPGHRRHRPRGLRPHRDHRARHGEPPRAAARSARSGLPLPGVDVRIADDGEILHARRQRLRAATAATTPRPPRRSATAGSTPATSASSTTTATCKITGRKKEILVTAGGKNVAPAVLEDRLRAHPLRQPVHRRRRPASRSSPRWSPSTRRCYPAWAEQPRARRRSPSSRPRDRRRRARRGAEGASTTPTRPCRKAESIRKFAILDARLHRGERLPHPVA